MEQSSYAVTCENIKKLPGCARLRIIAGAAGAFRQIRWVHYVEEPSYIQFLKGGELVLTTGLLLHDREIFLHFIRQLKSKNVSGIVINESPEGDIPYLEDIRKLCDELELCVFSLPFHCRFADIMQSITRQIFLNQQHKHDLDTMLFSLFFDPASPYLHGSDRLNDLGFQRRHCCFALVFCGKSGGTVELRPLAGQIHERMRLFRQRSGRNILYLLHGKELAEYLISNIGVFCSRRARDFRDRQKVLSISAHGRVQHLSKRSGCRGMPAGHVSARVERRAARAAENFPRVSGQDHAQFVAGAL